MLVKIHLLRPIYNAVIFPLATNQLKG